MELLKDQIGRAVKPQEFNSMIFEMQSIYGPHVAYANFRRLYNISTGRIVDPGIPDDLNTAAAIMAVWEFVKKHPSSSVAASFGDTLDKLTCPDVNSVTKQVLACLDSCCADGRAWE